MVGLLFALFGGITLIFALWMTGEFRARSRFPAIVLGGYLLRLILQTFIREVPLFSHGVGAVDSVQYEHLADWLAILWRHEGVHYVTGDEFVSLGPVSLPPNLFAVPIYLNDGPCLLGCVSLVALAAGLTVVNLSSLAIELGAPRRQTHLVTSVLYFDLAFLFYTSDTNKDGLVVCFTVGVLASAIRLTRRWSLWHVGIGAISIAALWYTRFYLVFVALAPLLVGLVGLGSRSVWRQILGAVGVGVIGIVLAAYTGILQSGSESAAATFEHGTSSSVIEGNAAGGSGVLFDDGGSPFSSLGPKLAYTLLSPFLWAGGSLGFHIGKIEALLWYFLVYRAVRGSKRIDTRLLITLLVFVAPCTLMYAMSMSNVGLIVRQRLVIVAGTTLLAAFYRPPERRHFVPSSRGRISGAHNGLFVSPRTVVEPRT